MNSPLSKRAAAMLAFVCLTPVASAVAAAYLELAPMLGHVSSTDARIWAKASEPAKLSVRIGTKPDLSGSRTVRGAKLEAGSGFMGHIVVSDLQPATLYHYSILLDGKPAMLRPYPSFTTAPREGEPGHVRIAFTSCVGYHGYDATAGYADMARTNIDLLLMLGDNHYANTNDPVIQRRFYFDQRNTAGWRGLSPGTPIYAIWDDHDFGPDNSDGTLKGKERALQTFQEHWANPAYGEPDNPGVYFKFTRANVDVFMLDVRYHRAPNKAANIAHKPHLGPRQLAWFKRELLESRAPVKMLAAGGEWQSFGTDDSWTSFKDERDEIFRFIEENKIKGVLLLSGDRHFTGAYHVRGQWIEVTSGPLGSSPAGVKKSPEAFLDLSATKGHFYCVYDLDTTAAPPKVTLEIYRVGDGLVHRRAFTWDEVTGATKIKTLPPLPKDEKPKADAAKPASDEKK
jgi:alkaline phosphatase D